MEKVFFASLIIIVTECLVFIQFIFLTPFSPLLLLSKQKTLVSSSTFIHLCAGSARGRSPGDIRVRSGVGETQGIEGGARTFRSHAGLDALCWENRAHSTIRRSQCRPGTAVLTLQRISSIMLFVDCLFSFSQLFVFVASVMESIRRDLSSTFLNLEVSQMQWWSY